MQATLAVAIAGFVLSVLALAWVFALAQRVRGLTSARSELARMAAAGDFVGITQALDARMGELGATDERLAADDAAIAARLATAVSHVGLVRFDALPGDVGEQSFAVALLDDRATGFVLTSMHGRGAYRLYAKPITEGVAELVLTDEERAATAEALTGTGLSVSSERRPRRVAP